MSKFPGGKGMALHDILAHDDAGAYARANGKKNEIQQIKVMLAMPQLSQCGRARIIIDDDDAFLGAQLFQKLADLEIFPSEARGKFHGRLDRIDDAGYA